MAIVIALRPIDREIAETEALLADARLRGDEDAIAALEIERMMLDDDLQAGRSSRHDQEAFEPEDLEIPEAPLRRAA